MKKIRDRFLEITSNWDCIRLEERDGKRWCLKPWKPVESTSCFDEAMMFGREDERKNIIEWLLQDHDQNVGTVSVLPIVGMGGLGKTTLAQMVYNDTRVCKHFDIRGWVCVSEDFNAASLTKKILASFSMSITNNFMSLDKLFETLKEELKGREFFLVLDDVWNEKVEVWDSLKTRLIGVGAGKIIVTTRNESLAKIMQTMPPIYLSNLSFDDCWSLFVKIAFKDSGHNVDSSLLDLGRKIVKKCGGLPLAVKVLAGIFLTEDDKEEWVNILESELWELDENDCNILPALRLSYDHMPTELRPCYMYLSLFPKDSLIDKPSIVKQWMSQGFLGPKRSGMMLEDIGNDYFDELLERSILQRNEDKFSMHDLIHDLSQSVGRDEYLLITTPKLYHIPRTIRHISIRVWEDFEAINLKPLFETKGIRTLMLPEVEGLPISDLLSNLTCLRTLLLYESPNGPITLPSDVIGNLKHLRYLEMHNVPKSVCKLYHLQTVIVHSYMKMTGDLGNLMNLRHLGGFRWHNLPHEIGELTDLQTLPYFIVGPSREECKVGQLKDLPNLRGLLEVTGLETATCSDVTPPASLLKNTQGIDQLKLHWSGNGLSTPDQNLAEEVLDCLRPHPDNLRYLEIEGYPGATLTWASDSPFPGLQEIVLGQVNYTSQLPTLGQLPTLKLLTVTEMKSVKSIGHEFLRSSSPVVAAATITAGGVKRNRSCCFPLLEVLKFEQMDEWEEWHGVEESDFPRIRELEIYRCPKLRRLPTLASLVQLEIKECIELRRLMPLPSLLKLEVSQCPQLRIGNLLLSLPSLVRLNINGCSKLRTFPSIPSLGRLVIENCPELRSITFDLPSLVNLQIDQCPKLGSFPYLSSLTGLELMGLPKLRTFPPLPSLADFNVIDCPKLRSLPSFPSLSSLVIIDWPELRRLPYLQSLNILCLTGKFSSEILSSCCLPMLRNLEIAECRGNTLVFTDNKSLHSIEMLFIYKCKGLKSVEGLDKLTSLRDLTIRECPNMQISENEQVPASLRNVKISRSPEAAKWYKNQALGGRVNTQMDWEIDMDDAIWGLDLEDDEINDPTWEETEEQTPDPAIESSEESCNDDDDDASSEDELGS